MSRIAITLTETDIKQLIYKHFEAMLGDVEFDEHEVTIEVKSKQNYKAEWETAEFRANLVKNVI